MLRTEATARTSRVLVGRRERRRTINVGAIERAASMIAAAGLLAWANRDLARDHATAARVGAGALLFRGLTGFCPVYAGARIATRGTDARRALSGSGGVHVRETVTVARPVGEVYAVWRNLENLPRFMAHLDEVRVLDGGRSHWVARPVGGIRLEWDAEIVNDVPNRVIGWRSAEGSDVISAGSVNFRPAPRGRGTEVRVVLQYAPPGGRLAASVAQLFGADAATRIRSDLRQFKHWLEAGGPRVPGRPPATS